MADSTDPKNNNAADLAADPATPLETLAQLAAEHPALRPVIARNPSTYPDLLTWLGQIGDPEIAVALASRITSSPTEPDTAQFSTPKNDTNFEADPTPEFTPALEAASAPDPTSETMTDKAARWLGRIRQPRVLFPTIGFATLLVVALVVTIALAAGTGNRDTGQNQAAGDTAQSSPAPRSPSPSATPPAFAPRLDKLSAVLAVGANAILTSAGIDPATGTTTAPTGSTTLYGKDAIAPVLITPVAGPGQEAHPSYQAVEALPDSPTMVAVALNIVTLQSGLVAAASALSVQTFDGSGRLVQNVPVPSDVIAKVTSQRPSGTNAQDISVEFGDLRLGNGVVVFALSANDDVYGDPNVGLLVGMNARSGTILWTATIPSGEPGCGGTIKMDSGVRGESAIIANNLYVYVNPAGAVTAINLTSGTQAWTNPLDGSCGYEIDSSFGAITNYIIVRPTGADWSISILSPSNGVTFATHATSAALDPVTNQLTLCFETSDSYSGNGYVQDGHPALEVVEGSTGSVSYSLPAAQGKSLGSLLVNASFDGRIWIKAGDKNEVIDAADGNPDPASSTLLAHSGLQNLMPVSGTASWTLFGAGINPGSGTLLRHPSGQVNINAIQSALAEISQASNN